MDAEFRAIERAWRSSPDDQELCERLRKASQRRWGFDPRDPIIRSSNSIDTTSSTDFVKIPRLDVSEEIAKRPQQSWLVTISACVFSERAVNRDFRLRIYLAIDMLERTPRERMVPQVVAEFALHGSREQALSTSAIVNREQFSAVWRVEGGTGAIRARSLVAVPLSPVYPSDVAPAV